jgi:DNA polymerase I
LTPAYLIDASPYIFRAFFSLPSSMVDREGNPVGAVYGFAGFLVKLISEEKPAHLAVAFDRSLNTSFRNQLYPAYKAQRELPPAALEAQLAACEEVAAALGAATFVDPLYESDDLLATLCDRVRQDGAPAVIVSSDKDLTQLVGDGVEFLDFGKGLRLGAADVAATFGVRPEQIPDLLGLAGEPVDNIPGVAGIGRKTAAALLASFDRLEDLYERLDEVKMLGLRGAAGLHAKLAAGRDRAFLSKELATLAHYAPVGDTRLADLAYRGADPVLVDPLFERLGFAGIRRRIPQWRENF